MVEGVMGIGRGQWDTTGVDVDYEGIVRTGMG